MRYSRALIVWVLVLVALAPACVPGDAEISQPQPTVGSPDVSSDPVSSDPEPTATAAPAPTATTEPVAAIVNGEPILLAEYERQVGRYEASMVAAGQDPDTPEGRRARAQGRQWVLDLMMEQKLIEQEAIAEGITVTDEEIEETLDSLRDDIGAEAFDAWLVQEGITLDEMRHQLRQDMLATQMANRIAASIPTQAEHVHARHIVVSTPEEAQMVLSQLQAGEDFASLARMHSQDMSTRDLGGDLGFFPLGVLTSPEVEAAAFALQPGQLSDVVQSELGYHIVQVVEREPDREIEPENLRLLRDQAVRVWLDELQASADIQVFIAPES
jgi:peptidyl-prolyl cis-trans isomerase C